MLCLGEDFKCKALNKVNATEYSIVCCVVFYEFMTFEFCNRTLKINLPICRNIKIINILSYPEDANRKLGNMILEPGKFPRSLIKEKMSKSLRRVKIGSIFDIIHCSNFTVFILLFLVFSLAMKQKIISHCIKKSREKGRVCFYIFT